MPSLILFRQRSLLGGLHRSQASRAFDPHWKAEKPGHDLKPLAVVFAKRLGILALTRWRNPPINCSASATLRPSSISAISDAEATEIAQPLPSKLTSRFARSRPP